MPTARSIMAQAGIVLLDEDHIRWPPAELAGWINLAVKAIILAKPSASARSIVIELVEGTLQHVPQTGTPTPLALLRIVRNIEKTDTPPVGNIKETSQSLLGGRIVNATPRAALDAAEPNWHDPRRVRFRKEVRQYVFDENTPLEFYVYPGNDGSGLVEAAVSVLPAAVAPTGPDDDLAAWDVEIGLPEPYSEPVLNYVLYRAYAKDDPARSSAYYSQFATAIGIKIQVEGASSPNARRTAT